MKVIRTVSLFAIVTIVLVVSSLPLYAGGRFILDSDTIQLTIPPGTEIEKSVNLLGGLEYYQRYIIEKDASWVSIEPEKGVVGPDISEDLKVTISTGDLEEGEYKTTIHIWETLNKKNVGVSCPMNVMLFISNEQPEITLVPRSLEMLPGQILQVIVANPMQQKVVLEYETLDPWIYVIPRKQTVFPGDLGVFFVRSSSIANIAGLWNSMLLINTAKESPILIETMEYPVTVNVPSGIQFSPRTISDPGSIAVTNTLDRVLYVEPVVGYSESYDVDIFKLEPEERKIINVSWEENKRPSYLEFKILGGKVDMHHLKVSKKTTFEEPEPTP